MREAQRRAERSISTGVRDRPAAQPEEEVRGCGERSRAVCRAPRGDAQVGRVVMLPHPRMDSGRNEEAAVRCAAARSGARSAFFYRKSGVGGWGGGAGGKHGAAAAVTSPRGVASVPAQLPRREPPGGGGTSSAAGQSPSPRVGPCLGGSPAPRPPPLCARAPRAPRPLLVLFHSAAGGRARATWRPPCPLRHWRRLPPPQARPPRRQGQKSGPCDMSSAEMGKFNISPDEDSSSYSSNSNDFSYPYPTKPAAMKRWGARAALPWGPRAGVVIFLWSGDAKGEVAARVCLKRTLTMRCLLQPLRRYGSRKSEFLTWLQRRKEEIRNSVCKYPVVIPATQENGLTGKQMFVLILR